MAYDIYGDRLRRGYCEVHPDVAEEYPCSVCQGAQPDLIGLDDYEDMIRAHEEDMLAEHENERLLAEAENGRNMRDAND